ncbi:MAG: T9SS type A sorting domain-containing protein [Longimicrobiales bacterium]
MIREQTPSYRCPGRYWRGSLVAGLLALHFLPSLVSAQSIEEKYQRNRNRVSPFNLTSSPTTVLQVNKFQCGLINNGFTCTDTFNSPTGGGGFWPTGTPNQYMFRSGLQVFGIIPETVPFAWAGDTVGAFFNEGTGLRSHGTPLTEIFNSLDANDFENWPDKGSIADFPEATAFVTDTALFNGVLIGRKAASQQDTWVMYWDGNPGPTGGRQHPMGILVEQRTVAWNYPLGNENIIYFIYKFTNITNNPRFQRENETRFFGGANALPDAGWDFEEVYVASDSDPDVTHEFELNYATGILPFNLGLSYEGTFFEPEFDYPPSEFFPPFFVNAPGIVAVKYLKSPVDPATGEEVGLTSFSLHTNGPPFNDPRDVQQGWRYVSLNIDAGKGDPNCTFAVSEIKARRSCFLNQSTADVRFFIGSGPFTLKPGQSATVAVAMYAAATVATSQIQRGANADNKPGIPSLQPGCGSNPIRPLEVASGWIRTRNCPSDASEAVSQFDVDVVPLSLLGRGLVAQSIFDNKFLLGFSPETPNFTLVPGDNQVTVVWDPSATDRTGDPFFVAAGDPDNALFDPNYRQFDVEGYRIHRGTSPSNLTLLTQFDKKGTVFVDNTCSTDPTFITGDPCDEVHEVDISSPLIQFPVGGVVRLADGSTIVVDADTASAGSPPMTNTGVPYAFIDRDVRNGFRYFYRITAFDVNSFTSGPSSLESAAPAKSVTPRGSASSVTNARYVVGLFGRGSTPLQSQPAAIDPVTGTFTGPQPPTALLSGQFLLFAPQLLPAGVKEVRIDSVHPGYYPNGTVGTYFLTVDGQRTSVVFENHIDSGDGSEEFELPVVSIPADPTIRQQLIAAGVEAPAVSGSLTSLIRSDRPHWHSGDADWAYKQPTFWGNDPPSASASAGGSRWFTGANETAANPTLNLGVGQIQGYTILKPNPYQQLAPDSRTGLSAFRGLAGDIFRRFYGTTMGVRRAADMKFYWGAAGLDSVVDVTHNVRVPFHPHVRASYGFLTDSDADGRLVYGDFYYIPGFENTANIGGLSTATPRPLAQQPVVLPVDVTGDLAADGTGFGLYIAGEAYLFQGPVPTNTVWTLRTYAGIVTRSATGVYSFAPTGANPAVPGLRFVLNVEAPAQIVADSADLTKIHTVPDPFYAVSQFDLSPATKEMKFVNLPAKATIRIYSMSGVLVDIVTHDDPAGGGSANWDLRNKSGQFVASGVYFYHVSTPEGKKHIGKFTVVNSGFAR